MASLYRLEKTSIENCSTTNLFPSLNSIIKQEVTEINETVPDCISDLNTYNLYNEFNIKEEIFESENVDSYCSLNELGEDAAQNLDALSEFNISDNLLECSSCDYKCYNETNLISHIKIHENFEYKDDKILSCPSCAYKTKRRSHFNDHVRSHTGDKPHQCTFCDYKSGLKGNLKRHIGRIHNSSGTAIDRLRLLQCAHCNYACPTKSVLIRHVKMHVLGQSYNLRSGSTLKHFEPLTDKKPPDILERQPEYIDIHSLNIDKEGNVILPIKDEEIPDVKPIPFDINEPTNLLKCKECQYTCFRKTHLNDHLKTHSGVKPFVCILCNYRTGHKSHLTRHMKVHVKREGHIILNIPPPPPTPVKKQVYRCLVCGYKSQIKHCFAKHMRLHLGVALFTCNICDFNAKCSADIKKHIKIHTGLSEFFCSTCDYMAKSKGRLIRHLAIHRPR